MGDDEDEERDEEWDMAGLGWLLTTVTLCLIALVAVGTILIIHRLLEAWW